MNYDTPNESNDPVDLNAVMLTFAELINGAVDEYAEYGAREDIIAAASIGVLYAWRRYDVLQARVSLATFARMQIDFAIKHYLRKKIEAEAIDAAINAAQYIIGIGDRPPCV